MNVTPDAQEPRFRPHRRTWFVAPALAAVAVFNGVAVGAAEQPWLRDASAESGLATTHFNGLSGELYFPEITGAGVALLDYDGDGDLDLYLVQGAMLGMGKTLDDATFPPPSNELPSDRLLRNDLVAKDGRSQPRFVDVTGLSGINGPEYGQAVAIGDVDGDGWPDVYVANLGQNRLWRNRGDGSFEDWTERSRTGDPGWGTAASFADLDRDGRVDLYVANYVQIDLAKKIRCYAPSTRLDYCGPSAYPPAADRLFHNLGEGRFEEVSLAWLSDYRAGPGLGVVVADFDADGWLDLYVGNDGAENQLWQRSPNERYTDEALLAGVAVNREGRPEASMGIDAGDCDGDGDLDLVMTHLAAESNTLYRNAGDGFFEDQSVESGLAAPSLPYTSFGIAWVDLDNDGLLDLPVLNGAVRIQEELAETGDPFPLEQPGQLFANRGGCRFEERDEVALRAVLVARGLAVGDVDLDGDEDLVTTALAGPARLLDNIAGDQRSSLSLTIRDDGSSEAQRAIVVVDVDGSSRLRHVHRDGSYASARDATVTFGLGNAKSATLSVRRRDRSLRWSGLRPGRYTLPLAPPTSSPSGDDSVDSALQ